jgi:DNA-directed RNA polymerases I and III subunit RPAC2
VSTVIAAIRANKKFKKLEIQNPNNNNNNTTKRSQALRRSLFRVLFTTIFNNNQQNQDEDDRPSSSIMSVNEVKLKQAVEAFVVRGTGPPNSRTFCIGDEDHTLGNAVRHVLMQNEQVGFAGYSVPHPSEPVVQIRVQTIATSKGSAPQPPPPTAIETLTLACQTLHDQCDIVLERLEELFPEVTDDRIRMEKILLEEGYEDDEEDDDEDEDNNNKKINNNM